MGRFNRINAAIQMDRDGIRSLTPKQRSRTLCGHVTHADPMIVVRCHKRAGYSTPAGNRCFTHARPALDVDAPFGTMAK